MFEQDKLHAQVSVASTFLDFNHFKAPKSHLSICSLEIGWGEEGRLPMGN